MADQTAEARERLLKQIDAAHAEMCAAVERLHKGKQSLRLSIPARPGHDTDLIVCNALMAAREVIAALTPPEARTDSEECCCYEPPCALHERGGRFILNAYGRRAWDVGHKAAHIKLALAAPPPSPAETALLMSAVLLSEMLDYLYKAKDGSVDACNLWEKIHAAQGCSECMPKWPSYAALSSAPIATEGSSTQNSTKSTI